MVGPIISSNYFMPLTFLIVENFYFLRLALRRQVELLFPGAQVIEAGTPVEALALAQTNNPQVVVIDIGLTGSGGLKEVKYLKDIVPLAIVVVLTGYKDDMHWADASASGADACIVKAMIRIEFPLILTRLVQLQPTCE
jgi:DNA-binding NarL/FixJ family response regulator